MLIVFLCFAFACPSAEAEDVPGSEITDLTFLTAQVAWPDDPNAIDGTNNKYKFVKVFFRAGADLAALSKSHDRDMHVAAYRCDAKSQHMIHDSYATDPSIFDAYGEITRNRSATKTDALERFKGLYYFFMPTSGSYSKGSSYVFEPPYDLYSYMQDMCFEIPGTTSSFYSNEVTIPKSLLQTVLSKRPH